MAETMATAAPIKNIRRSTIIARLPADMVLTMETVAD
jgi:hypothetical protein